MRLLRTAARKVAVFHLPVRDLVDEPLTAPRPALKPRHVGLGPGLVDKEQTRGIDALLIGAPSTPMTVDV
jgi:hypothetical protein